MALRLIEVFLPLDQKERVQEVLKEHTVLGSWEEKLLEGNILIRLLLPGEETEVVLDLMEKHFSTVANFRIILLPVEASIPRPEISPEAPPQPKAPPSQQKPDTKIAGISREELYADIEETINLSWVFIVLVLLSSVVAVIGILRNNVVVVIGAMVIAPLLGPNVALSFATTLGDINLARRAMKTNLFGILAALILSILLGFVLPVNPAMPEILLRTKVDLGDIVLALVAGSAAALSFTTGILSALIGVMVAVSLLPPLVTLGMLIGAGQWEMAFGAMLLLLTNLICINLAGVVTFFVRGVHPLTWWEENRAKKATRIAIVLWMFLLLVLAVVILLSQRS
jgi:uncharacterized hydrophobic protein (TIGR00341 family)